MEIVNVRQIKTLMGLSRHWGTVGMEGNGVGRESDLVFCWVERAVARSSNPAALGGEEPGDGNAITAPNTQPRSWRKSGES